jgi:hypothetical protein
MPHADTIAYREACEPSRAGNRKRADGKSELQEYPAPNLPLSRSIAATA